MNVFVGGIFNFQHHLLLSTFGIPWWRDQTHLTHLLPDFRIPTHGFWVFKVCPICWRWSLHDGRAKEARMTISVQYVDCKLKLVWRIPVDVFFPAGEKWLMVSNSFFERRRDWEMFYWRIPCFWDVDPWDDLLGCCDPQFFTPKKTFNLPAERQDSHDEHPKNSIIL